MPEEWCVQCQSSYYPTCMSECPYHSKGYYNITAIEVLASVGNIITDIFNPPTRSRTQFRADVNQINMLDFIAEHVNEKAFVVRTSPPEAQPPPD